MTIGNVTFYLSDLFWLFIFCYVLVVSIAIIMENRSPQSTFAWLFLLILFPVIGLLIYIFAGRGNKTFSHENKLARLELGSVWEKIYKPMFDRQKSYMEKIAADKPESYRHQLLNLVTHNSSSLLTAYNKVEILQNATEKYPRLMEDIRNAKQSIHLMYYIWTEDDFTREVKDALIERSKAGVKVRCLVDQSSFVVSKEYQEELKAAGVQYLPYMVYKRLNALHNANYRSHRKIAIIDGKIGFVGGMNLDREQLPGVHPLGFWRDTHLRFEGEAALVLQAIFGVSWFNTTGDKLTDDAYYPQFEPGSRPFLPVQITNGGPDSQWKAMSQLYFFMIMSAKEKCYLQSPFFVPDESLLEAIKSAALSGVDVRIMCTPRGGSYQMPYRAALTYFADVARAGAKVYMYEKGYFHCKTINVDGEVCAVGTANFDIRSFQLNYETMAVVYDKGISQELEQDFLNDIKDCKEWKLEDYEKEPAWRRFADSVDRLLSPIL